MGSAATAAMIAAFKLLGIMFGVFVLLLALIIVFLMVSVKNRTKGKVVCFFWANRRWEPQLLREDKVARCVWLGRGEAKEKYNLRDANQGWVDWPINSPHILQVPVRAYEFFRNQSEARRVEGDPETGEEFEGEPREIDSETGESSLSARSNFMATDEVMLRSTWRDAREGIGLPLGGDDARKQNLIMIMGFGCIMLLVGFSLFIGYQNNKTTQQLNDAFNQRFPAPITQSAPTK